jgi:hypothetical protein
MKSGWVYCSMWVFIANHIGLLQQHLQVCIITSTVAHDISAVTENRNFYRNCMLSPFKEISGPWIHSQRWVPRDNPVWWRTKRLGRGHTCVLWRTEEVRQGRPAKTVLGAWRKEESASLVLTAVSIRRETLQMQRLVSQRRLRRSRPSATAKSIWKHRGATPSSSPLPILHDHRLPAPGATTAARDSSVVNTLPVLSYWSTHEWINADRKNGGP